MSLNRLSWVEKPIKNIEKFQKDTVFDELVRKVCELLSKRFPNIIDARVIAREIDEIIYVTYLESNQLSSKQFLNLLKAGPKSIMSYVYNSFKDYDYE